ncbi:hypothetical protein AX17_007528 [Amanita inopinata Kibby_2008]|nr:hypothetical protein AX17_007528 [Amanita inopinata Kibby_2008]
MLSAIAARKAAQATAVAGGNAENVRFAPSTVSPEPSPERGEVPSRTGVKRKSERRVGSDAGDRRRKKKAKKSLQAKGRYFVEQQDAFQDQEDVIVVESDEESVPGSDVEELSMDVEDEQISGAAIPSKRAWSPSMPLQDSSSDEGSGEEREQQAGIPLIQALSTFKPVYNQNIFYVSQDKLSILNLSSVAGTLLALSPEENVCIAGTYTLTVLQGTISFLGVKLCASSRTHRIYAPRSSPLPVIEAVSSEPSILHADMCRQLEIPEINGAVVLLQELRSGVQGLGRVCKTFGGVFDFSRYERQEGNEGILNVTGAYMLGSRMRDCEPFTLPKSWSTALENVKSSSTGGVYLVKGRKKSGKSTFARTLLNHLLTRYERVAYLECDPGQSEFTPGGMVALNVIHDYCFGPPFTHPTIPNAAHYIGGTTPRSSPAHYLTSIQALFQSYELDIRNPIPPYSIHMDIANGNDLSDRISDVIPLVVNTMGWSKGLGADLTRRVQEIIQPTHIFEFIDSNPQEFFSFQNMPDPNTEREPCFHAQLDPAIPSPTSPLHTQFTAADHRALNILSHFHAVFPTPPSHEASDPSTASLDQVTATSWRTALPLCAQPPYAVDWRVALDRIVLVGSDSEDVVPAEIGGVLNGAVVGIVASWGDDSTVPGAAAGTGTGTGTGAGAQTSEADSDLSIQMPYVQGSQPPSPASSTCFGLALIRSVSHCSPPAMGTGMAKPTAEVEVELHVLSPVPAVLLKRGRVFVKGEMELPIWGMLDYGTDGGEDRWKNGVAGVEWGRVPYLQWGKGEGVGSERRRVRRNLMRKGQM